MSAVMFHPAGPTRYVVNRVRDLTKLGYVDKIAQDWRSRRNPSWSFRDDAHRVYGTARTRRQAADALLEVYERRERGGQ